MVFFNIISIHQCVGGTAVYEQSRQRVDYQPWIKGINDIIANDHPNTRPDFKQDGNYNTDYTNGFTGQYGLFYESKYQREVLTPLKKAFIGIGFSAREAKIIADDYDKCRNPEEKTKFTNSLPAFWCMGKEDWIDDWLNFMGKLPQSAIFDTFSSQLEDAFIYWQDTFTELINNLVYPVKAPPRPAEGKYFTILLPNRTKPSGEQFHSLASELSPDKKEEAKYVHYVLGPLREFLQLMGLNEAMARQAVNHFDINYRTGERRQKFIDFLYSLWYHYKCNVRTYQEHSDRIKMYQEHPDRMFTERVVEPNIDKDKDIVVSYIIESPLTFFDLCESNQQNNKLNKYMPIYRNRQSREDLRYLGEKFPGVMVRAEHFRDAPRRPVDGQYCRDDGLSSDQKAQVRYVKEVLDPLQVFFEKSGFNEQTAKELVEKYDTEYRTGEKRQKFIKFLKTLGE